MTRKVGKPALRRIAYEGRGEGGIFIVEGAVLKKSVEVDRYGNDGFGSCGLHFCAGENDAGMLLSASWDWKGFFPSDLFSSGTGLFLYAQPQKVSFPAMVLCTGIGDSV